MFKHWRAAALGMIFCICLMAAALAPKKEETDNHCTGTGCSG